MFKTRLVASIGLFSLAFASLVSAASAEHVWAFGDSLSDNGNLALLFATDGINSTYLPPEAFKPFFPLGPSVPLQRLSTGKIFIEYLAEHYGSALLPSGLESEIGETLANNFAVFGARATPTSQLDLPYQVAQLATRVSTGLDVTQDRALVAIGSNDVFAAWSRAIQPLAAGATVLDIQAGKDVIDSAIESLRAYLIGDGGTVQRSDGSTASVPSLFNLGLTQFTIMNVANIGVSPLVLQQARALGGRNRVKVNRAARGLSRYFNDKLKRMVKEMQSGYFVLDVQYIDLYKTASRVRKEAIQNGIIVNQDCFLTNTLNTLTSGVPPTPGVFRDTCGPSKTEEFMFIDSVHPTGTFHEEMAKRILSNLD